MGFIDYIQRFCGVVVWGIGFFPIIRVHVPK